MIGRILPDPHFPIFPFNFGLLVTYPCSVYTFRMFLCSLEPLNDPQSKKPLEVWQNFYCYLILLDSLIENRFLRRFGQAMFVKHLEFLSSSKALFECLALATLQNTARKAEFFTQCFWKISIIFLLDASKRWLASIV